MYRKVMLGLIFCIISFASIAQRNNTSSIHRRLNLQYAGNIGLISVGTGREFYKDQFMVDLHLGYLPRRFGHSQVFTIAAKTSIVFIKKEIQQFHLNGYCGTTLAYSITNNTYLRYPSYYPNSYYDFPNSFHFFPYLGLLSYRHQSQIAYYLEFGSTDYKLIAAYRNNCLGLRDVLNISLGLSYFLK